MTGLTDRYVGEVLRTIPAPLRADVEQELRASIADAIEAGSGTTGGDPATAEAHALSGLGDPTQLAASLTDGPQYLIGPGLYWDYRRALRALLLVIPATVTLTVSLVQALTGTAPLAVAIDGAWLLVVVGFQVAVWTTLGFAIAERTGVHRIPGRRPWRIEDLPDRPARAVGLAETVASVLGLLIGIAALAWQQVGARVPGTDDAVPVLDPALWSFWLPAAILLMSLGVLLHVLAFARGRWTPVLAGVRVAADAVAGLAGVTLLLTQQVLNPAFFTALGHPQWAEPGSPLAQGLAWLIGVGVVIDIVDAVRRARA